MVVLPTKQPRKKARARVLEGQNLVSKVYAVLNLISAALPLLSLFCLPFHCSQDGTAEDDKVFAATMGSDGSIVLAGETNGNWDGTSNGKMDFAAIKLDADGLEIWRWQVKQCIPVNTVPIAVANTSQGLIRRYNRSCNRTSVGAWELRSRNL